MQYFETNTYKKLKDKPQDNFPQLIVVHHTGGENGVDTSNQTAKIVEDYHLSLGWEGMGYQFYIEKDGDIWRGRPEHYHGAHTSEQGTNKKSIGICLAGNFDITLPSEAQVTSLTQLLNELKLKYNISNDNIFPHRHFTPKSCFGSKLPDDWAKKLVSGAIDKEQIKRQIIDLVNKL